ncbi:PP2C family protein-serine/threonine phosphatase [Streptomyces tropicalis]|uniref:PP2C family protein-serine/threonine phosphatase n=1 Tax=Streptomyces tropicalis TaxID=3034234 RepID=A0ABT6A5Z6_9ACTN|nr:PP2C family protein-serine/threonine phosphatase [Streptomyces tropicalis]MDF3299796.1 PP2C family protein-serine/threonine phosphatase [Streptomyces tropicalis]
MNRIRAGAARSAPSRRNSRTATGRGARADVRTPVRRGLPAWARAGARRPERTPSAGPGSRPPNRALALGPPTVWGALAVTYRLTCPLAQGHGLGSRLATGAFLLAAGTGLVLTVRRTLLRELRQARAVAGAAQRVVLRPLPSRVEGLDLAAAHLSADRGALVGGDLYEVIATEHGVRLVVGDVRGHGLAALGTVAAVLGSFREAAHDEPELAGVLRRLERALGRHLRERARTGHPVPGPEPEPGATEDFVTVLLLEIDPAGRVHALNCGHPWPYRLGGHGAVPLARAEPLPPLGPFPLPAALDAADVGRLPPGEALVLYTDGAEDARDAKGRFFPLAAVLAEAAADRPVVPQSVLRTVLTRLLRHTGGRPADDVAVLVVRNGRPARACAGPAAARGAGGPSAPPRSVEQAAGRTAR